MITNVLPPFYGSQCIKFTIQWNSCLPSCCVRNSDTLTDVSSLHDLDDVSVNDDTTSLCTRVVTNDTCTTDDTADNLSDLTIPDFAVSFPFRFVFICQFYFYAPTSVRRGHYKMSAGVRPSVCHMPWPNSRTERSRKPKIGRMEARQSRG